MGAERALTPELAAEEARQAPWSESEAGLAVEVAGPCYSLLTFYKGERVLVVSMACRPVGDPDLVRLEPAGAVGWRWASTGDWEELAATGRSSWNTRDVRRATKMVAVLWETEDG